jgi:hypothetical protein
MTYAEYCDLRHDFVSHFFAAKHKLQTAIASGYNDATVKECRDSVEWHKSQLDQFDNAFYESQK